MSADDANLPGAKRENEKRVGRYGRAPFALMVGRNHVRNLHGLVRARRVGHYER